ncbi:MAG: aminoglycoside 6-adenylyltransferase [Sporolactobacillus sp.]
MRSQREMVQLILGVAAKDERIRAVYMNGSRANPNAKKDIFQDYDMVYVVTDIASFLADAGWTRVFGEPIITQEPDKLDQMIGKSVNVHEDYMYLMQFTDGNRIDLHLQSLVSLKKEYGTDKLTVPLLDKDDILPPLPSPTDADYWVKKPTYGEYYSCCNNFWWVAPYCAKGLWRREVLYAVDVMNDYVRRELLTMLSWHAGIATQFKVSLGKANKNLKAYLPSDAWTQLMQTYNWSDYDAAWRALLLTCDLFAAFAPRVGRDLGYTYEAEEAQRSFAFIRHIKDLPEDATQIY